MFFRKKTAQPDHAAAQRQAQILKSYQHSLDAADATPDAADKFLKLEAVKDAIDAQLTAAKADITLAARAKFRPAYAGVAGGTTLGVSILVLGLHAPPVLLLLAYPGIYGGMAMGHKAIQKEEAKLLAQNAPFFAALEETKTAAAAKADVILIKDLTALAQSPRFEEIVAKAPRVRDHFTAAFARKIAEDGAGAPPPPKKPPGHGGLQL